MFNLCTSTDYSALSSVFISGMAGVYIGTKDPTELNECQHKRRGVNCHAEISVENIITQTTDSYVIQSAALLEAKREIDVILSCLVPIVHA